MFQLLLIRHAQSANNFLPESQRVPDPGLTPKGHQQAKALANWLASYRPTQLFCSGFRRALDTTKTIAAMLDLQPSVRIDLFEQGGCYSGYQPGKKEPSAGLGRSQILRDFGDWVIDERIPEAGWHSGRDLESLDDAIARSHNVAQWIMEDLLPNSPKDQSCIRPALIIHADFKALLLESLLSNQLETTNSSRRYQVSAVWNAAVSQLTWIGSEWQLDFWNSIGHMPSELLTQ